jgi:ribonuclease HII
VVAAAVILDPRQPIAGLADSKKLSAGRRVELAALIKQQALSWAVGEATVAEIDAHNILQASLLAMRRAVEGLILPPRRVLVDGLHLPVGLPCAALAIVKGDQTIACISAASIIAKTHRDALLDLLDKQYPGYGFGRHKGYGTARHLAALRALGPTPAHRRSFAPVRALLESA